MGIKLIPHCDASVSHVYENPVVSPSSASRRP